VNETLLTIFVVVTAVAVVLQMGLLLALYLRMKQSSARVDALAEQALAILTDVGPKVRQITGDLVEVAGSVRAQFTRLDATISDLVDRTRLQVIRADELVSHALDRVEETSEMVQHSVISPIRQISGLVQAVTAGIETFIRRGKPAREAPRAAQDEELFI